MVGLYSYVQNIIDNPDDSISAYRILSFTIHTWNYILFLPILYLHLNVLDSEFVACHSATVCLNALGLFFGMRIVDMVIEEKLDWKVQLLAVMLYVAVWVTGLTMFKVFRPCSWKKRSLSNFKLQKIVRVEKRDVEAGFTDEGIEEDAVDAVEFEIDTIMTKRYLYRKDGEQDMSSVRRMVRHTVLMKSKIGPRILQNRAKNEMNDLGFYLGVEAISGSMRESCHQLEVMIPDSKFKGGFDNVRRDEVHPEGGDN